jgi:hypothetical protein
MKLNEIEIKALTHRVVILQTHELIQLFITDTVRKVLGASQEQYFDVSSKNELKNIYSLGSVQPFGASKWFIVVDLDKIPISDLVQTFDHGESCFFLCVTSKYFNFKKLKEALNKHNDIQKKKKLTQIPYEELYLTYLRKADFYYLYSNYLGDIPNKLTENLVNYVYKNYAGDLDALFLLLDALREGEEFQKEKDIIAICGLGRNTTQNFIIKIMTSTPKTEKGLKSVIRKNLQRGFDLSSDLEWGMIWTFTRAFVRSSIEIKSLCISGVVYEDLHALPDGYDQQKLIKYNRYMWFIRSQPLSKLLAVYKLLDDFKWTSELEFYKFLCEYYKYTILIEKEKK